MKKLTGFLLLGIVLLNYSRLHAQSYAESALMFSRSGLGGSARVQGLGGAQVSLGGDFSSAYSNPAGLGMYNRSEFTITPGFSSTQSSSDYLNNTTTGGQSRLILPGLSFVLHTEKERMDGSIRRGTFGISINRFNDFNRTFSYQGTNTNTSIIDYFANDATGAANQYSASSSSLFDQGGYLRNTPTELAFDNYLINQSGNYQYTADTLGTYNNNAVGFFGKPTQAETVKTRGSQFQVSLSYGLNFNDKLFLGAGLGLTSLDYSSTKSYSELYQGGNGILQSMGLSESLRTTGSGINLTLGAIYRPVSFFQAGFSFATPTVYTLNDNYSARMVSNWNHFIYQGNKTDPAQGTFSTDQVISSYGLNTPLRVSGGLTFFIKKYGFITGDVEYLSYAKAKYTVQPNGGLTSDDIKSFNNDIQNSYRAVYNFRFGGEYRFKKYRARAGYNFMPDPFRSAQLVSANIQSYSVGVGYRSTKFFVDLTTIFKQSSSVYYPYTYADPVVTKYNTTMVMATVGFPF